MSCANRYTVRPLPSTRIGPDPVVRVAMTLPDADGAAMASPDGLVASTPAVTAIALAAAPPAR